MTTTGHRGSTVGPSSRAPGGRMRTALRASVAGAAALGLSTLIIVGYLASVDEPSLEAIMFLPVMFVLAALGSALLVGSAKDFLAFCAGAVVTGTVIVLVWGLPDGVDLALWF